MKEAVSLPPVPKVPCSEAEQNAIREYFARHAGIQEGVFCTTADEAVARLQAIYDNHTLGYQEALQHPTSIETLFSSTKGTYPYLGFYVAPQNMYYHSATSYGFVGEPGFYGSTITRPHLFIDYLREQIQFMIDNHGVLPFIGPSNRMIPISFLSEEILFQVRDFSQLRSLMSLPSLRDIDDRIANGGFDWANEPIKPLTFFTAERVDYSLGRLSHYCGTDVKYFQKFILLTNYQRYVDLFFQYAQKVLHEDSGYVSWVEPHNHVLTPGMPAELRQREGGHGFQMPAYHLTREDGMGITLINIGVGTSNAKNITDHLAVLRPHCWVMIGHCAGLRYDQILGDYILAHGYVRNDHVLDDDLPLWIPVPAIAEIQQALQGAVAQVTGLSPHDLRYRMRTGTVVSTGNRNWELRIKELSSELNMSRAIALDMESATLAANGFRFRVPYGTLLCVSDRPLHGELKLKAMAKDFYQQRVQQHLEIGILTMEMLRANRAEVLHSRKLRGFQEPPFR